MTTLIPRAAVLEILRTPTSVDTFPDMIRRVEALEGCGVRVKALEWSETQSEIPNHAWQAWTGFGRWVITLRFKSMNFAEYWLFSLGFPTLESAKAAAQADYEARILAALEPVAQPETPTPGQFTTMCLAIEDAVTGRVFDVDPWQPIETEPKDGESVLIWKPDERMVGEYMMAAYWDDRQGGYVPVGGVHKQGYYSETAGRDQGYPTHWMPLPKPPK